MNRQAVVVAGVAFATVTLAGCAATPQASGPSGPAMTGTSAPSSPSASPPQQSLLDQPFPVDTAGSAHGPYVPWTLIRVDPNENRIYLSAESHDCVQPSAAHLSETSTTITVEVEGASTANASGVCTLESRTLVGWITPQSPVAARQILHGQTD